MTGKIILQYSANPSSIAQETLKALSPSETIHYDWLFLCRDTRRARFLRNSYLKLHELSAGLQPPFLTWPIFLDSFSSLVPLPHKHVSESEEIFLLYQALQLVRDKLRVLNLTRRPLANRIIKDLHNFVRAALHQRIESKHRWEEMLEVSRDALWKDLMQIARAYDRLKSETFLDEADLLLHIVNKFDLNRLPKLYPRVQALYWEIERPLLPLQVKFLEWLREAGWTVQLLFFFDKHPDFFGNLERFFQRIQSLADEVCCTEGAGKLTQAFYRLENTQPRLSQEVQIWKLPNRLQEVREVVKQIKFLLVEGLFPAERIVITTPDLFKYLSFLTNALKNYRIPYSLQYRVPLKELLPIQHLRLLLELIYEDAPLYLVKRILRSRFFKYHEMLERVRLEEILNGLRVAFDLSLMISQLEKSIGSMEARWPEDIDVNGARLKEEKLRLLKALQMLHDDTTRLGKRFNAKGLFQFFTTMFEKHQIVSRVLTWESSLGKLDVANILGALRSFIEVLDAWRAFNEKLSPAPEFKGMQALEIFDLILTTRTYQPYAARPLGVKIAPLEAVDTEEIDALFILGMTDADFPGKGTSVLKRLPQPYDHLPADDMVYTHRQLFLKCLQVPRLRIVFSYPEQEGETPLVPSGLLFELQRLTGVPFSKPEEISIYSRSELLKYMQPLIVKSGSTELRRLWSGVESVIDRQDWRRYNQQLDVVTSRHSPVDASIYEGNLSEDSAMVKYFSSAYRDYDFSISALETYARCPLLFFFKRVLNLEEPTEFEDWITPQEKGSLVHGVLYRFYAGKIPVERTLERLLRIAREEIEKLPFQKSILWELQKEAFIGSDSRKGLFPAFFEYEQDMQQAGIPHPLYCELPFGNVKKWDATIDEEVFIKPLEFRKADEYIRLKGVVDRVELMGGQGVVVVDYKTGNLPSLRDLVEGRSLQLPLYLLAVSELFRAKYPTREPLAAVYYKVKSDRPGEIFREVLFADHRYPAESVRVKQKFPAVGFYDNKQEWQLTDLLHHSLEFAIQYAEGIRQGRFLHTNDLSQCGIGRDRHCPFQSLCRVDESRQRFRARQRTEETHDEASEP